MKINTLKTNSANPFFGINSIRNIFSILTFLGILLSCQNKPKKQIEGTITHEMSSGDSIFFTSGFIDTCFFKKKILLSNIDSIHFNLYRETLPYPHLYAANFKSERDSIFRMGKYFIDETTDKITIDLNKEECSLVNGKTHEEFKNKFIPFFIHNYDCKLNLFSRYIFKNGKEFESKLLDYVKTYPDSYVALWFLIERFSRTGYFEHCDEILSSFSPSIKNGELWKKISEQLKKVRIKINKKFPELELKNIHLNGEKLALPNSKYILIDYWFSRCIPCLKSFPSLKNIYDKYQDKGFEIISISVDRTKDIEKWIKAIDAYDLNWIHYLDENREQSRKDKIIYFPTTFLLDKNGRVIKKNPSLEEVEMFLYNNLK